VLWEHEYARKLQTADEALGCVKSGMRVYIQPGCAEPETLVEALMRRAPEVHDVEIVHMMTMGAAPYVAVITGARKNFKPRKIIVGFVLRTKKIFGFVDNNPIFEFHPTAYTNDPGLIARNDRMVAINSALQVDLTGQVCSDSIGNQFYSGIGGQVDFCEARHVQRVANRSSPFRLQPRTAPFPESFPCSALALALSPLEAWFDTWSPSMG
jgi:acyl-CoA hydrolase